MSVCEDMCVGICVCIYIYICVCVVLAVWCSGCVLGSGPEVSSSPLRQFSI